MSKEILDKWCQSNFDKLSSDFCSFLVIKLLLYILVQNSNRKLSWSTNKTTVVSNLFSNLSQISYQRGLMPYIFDTFFKELKKVKSVNNLKYIKKTITTQLTYDSIVSKNGWVQNWKHFQKNWQKSLH